MLYLALAVGVVGIFFGGFEIQQPAFKGFDVARARPALLFPFLFVTIACGACSGFHGLVCSGTTSKQIEREAHCQPIGYGAMLLEGFVAVIALATIMIVATPRTAGKAPGAIYGAGLGAFLAVIDRAIRRPRVRHDLRRDGVLDLRLRHARRRRRGSAATSCRSCSAGAGGLGGRAATAVTCGVPLFFVLLAGPGGYRNFWTLFGTSNQLLAALSLLGITVWLKKSGRRYWYTLWPMVFVSAVTITALVLQIGSAFTAGKTTIDFMNGVVCVVLLALASSLLYLGGKVLLEPATPATDLARSP